jgi:hypothetical protein
VSMTPKVLVDWCTYPPVGHAIEGLWMAAGVHAAGEARVSIVLNRRSATELTECCPWLDASYAVDFDVFGDDVPPDLYRDVPEEWDYLVTDPYRHAPRETSRFPQLARLAAVAGAHYRLRHGERPTRVKEPWLRLELPGWAEEEGATVLSGDPLVISVLPSGGGERSAYPSRGSWQVALSALRDAWPGARLVILGKSPGSHGRRHSAMSYAEADQLCQEVGALNGYDLPLLVQLAVVEQSSLFFSPHSGFGFAVLAVGTPWLTLSGGAIPEYFFNGTPFYSLLPDPEKYPAFDTEHVVEDDDESGPRSTSMTRARVLEAIPEMQRAARSLIEAERSYEECLASYFPRLLAVLGGDPDRIASWDGVHRRFV